MSKIVNYENALPEERAMFDKAVAEANEKERQWFKARGYSEADMMFADAEYKKYLQAEEKFNDKKPFDKAPGFRRIFMMGYFYGRYT